MKRLGIFVILTLTLTIAAQAQVATGGIYKIEQSLIASGGATNATGGTFTLDGAIGEPVAGTTSTASPFRITGGFFTERTFAPTAASASFDGRIETLDGRGLRNARVILIDAGGNQQSVLSSVNGSFHFDNLRTGEVYIVSVASKLFVFPTQVIFIGENLDNIVIKAIAQNVFATPLTERVKEN